MDYLTISIPSFNSNNYNLEILDLSGRCLLKQLIHSSETEKINVSTLEKGTYILRIQNSQSQYISSFVKN